MRWILLLAIALPALAQGPTRGQGMDPWERMKRFDDDGDGKVTKKEFEGPDRMFDRFDTNKDGTVTQSEVRERRRRGRGSMGGRSGGADKLKRAADSDKSGSVSKKEWDAYFDKMDENGDGVLDDGELRAALAGSDYADSAPKLGSAAPKVTVARRSDGKSAALEPKRKPLVLVFGSWT